MTWYDRTGLLNRKFGYGTAKIKKAVMSEKQPCIIIVDTNDNSIVAKLPEGHDITGYDRFRYCFYYVGRRRNEVN